MSEPFLAEIRIFPYNFAPQGWAFCDGQLLPISQNTALFALLGTTYGGDGQTTFALPNLQGCAPMHPGDGPGLTLRALGEQVGDETITLRESELPTHNHGLQAALDAGDLAQPTNRILGRSSGGSAYTTNASGLVTLAPEVVVSTGDSVPHNNMQPYLTLHFCIALQGVFPSRS